METKTVGHLLETGCMWVGGGWGGEVGREKPRYLISIAMGSVSRNYKDKMAASASGEVDV